MKRLIFALLIIAVSAYASSMVFKDLNSPLFCADCHATEYKNYISPLNTSDLPAHKEKNITCIECHSSPGIQSGFAAKRLLINVQLINYSLPALNKLLSSNLTLNKSFNASEFSIFRANCTKCHEAEKIKSTVFNHSNVSNCENCHLMHTENKTSQKSELSFWKRIGEGGHRNVTCGDCHGVDPTRLEDLPQCTKCHTPHLKGAQWDRSICLGCHSDPHLPVKNATFSGALTKEMCAACHSDIYNILVTYNSKHNLKVPSCTTCHPKHREALSCENCHVDHGSPHTGSKCYSCHKYVKKCSGCHTNPHNPAGGLPRITTKDQWSDFAQEVKNRTVKR